METSSTRATGSEGFAPDARLDFDILIAGIKDMLDRCDTSNKNDLLTIAILALIEGGITTGPGIVGAACGVGFDRRHAGALLKRTEGQHWLRGDSGTYRVNNN